MGSSQGGHRCGAGHGIFDDKVSEYGLKDVENLVVGSKLSRMSVPFLGFCRPIYTQALLKWWFKESLGNILGLQFGLYCGPNGLLTDV